MDSCPRPISLGPEVAEAPPPKTRPLEFNLTPRQVKEHLDRFVIRQDEAKKVLAIAICDHYHHVQAMAEGKVLSNYAKQNVLIVGPTGVGKTYLVKCLAELVGVPMVRADATKFTETGYVGGDVEDLVRDLVNQAEGTRKRRSTASFTSTRSISWPVRRSERDAMSADAACRPTCSS